MCCVVLFGFPKSDAAPRKWGPTSLLLENHFISHAANLALWPFTHPYVHCTALAVLILPGFLQSPCFLAKLIGL